MNIELVKLSPEYKEQLLDMLTEWKADIEKNHTNRSPWAIFKNDFHDFEHYQHLDFLEYFLRNNPYFYMKIFFIYEFLVKVTKKLINS